MDWRRGHKHDCEEIAQGPYRHRVRRNLGFYYGSMEDHLHVRYHVQLRRMQRFSDMLNIQCVRRVAQDYEEDEGPLLGVSQTRTIVRQVDIAVNRIRLERTYEDQRLEPVD